MAKFHVSAVTNLIIDFANKIDVNLTNLKLQKILFFVNGIYYSEKDEVLFAEEMRAWEYGPIIPEIYYEFKRFGSSSLNKTKSYIFDPEIGDILIKEIPSTNNEYKVIEALSRLFFIQSASDLVNMSHRGDSPWSRYFDSQHIGGKEIIFEDKDKKFFNKIANEIYTKYL